MLNKFILALASAGLMALSTVFTGCFGVEPTNEAPNVASESAHVVIKVTGTPGLRFSGNIGDAGHQNAVATTTVPAELKIENPSRSVLITLQKSDKVGTLKVAVLRDGKELARGQSSARWGMVNLAVPMKE